MTKDTPSCALNREKVMRGKTSAIIYMPILAKLFRLFSFPTLLSDLKLTGKQIGKIVGTTSFLKLEISLNGQLKSLNLLKSSRAVFTNKNNQSIDYLTILFVVVFTLLRVTQYCIPVPSVIRRDSNPHITIDKHVHNIQNPTIRALLDKGILEIKDDTLVPGIKFSGVLLYLLIAEFLTILYSYNRKYFYSSRLLNKVRVFNLLCSFRL